jgi:anti-sigma regulatory factor (Ser/Thr protein kinase)
MHIETELPASTFGPRLARGHVDRSLETSSVPEPVVEVVRLLVSELVTNSVRHAGLTSEDSVVLCLDSDESSIRVEVRDPGPGFHVESSEESQPPAINEGGWGLLLVNKLSDRWGVSREGGVVTWFEVDVPSIDTEASSQA